MPITPTYPGVYIEEIPSGVRTITGVATSIAGFIGFFKRGIMNRPVQIFNMGDFNREFGGLHLKSEAGYAIQQFFQNGGTEAWVVRTASGSVRAASVQIQSSIEGATALTIEAGQLDPIAHPLSTNPGAWGNNLRVKIDYPMPTSGDSFNMTVFLVESRNGREVVVQSEEFRGLTMTSNDTKFVQTVVNDRFSGSKLVRVTATGNDRPLQNGTLSGALNPFPNITNNSPQVNVSIGTDASGTATLSSVPTTLAEARTLLEAAIRSARPERRAFSEASVLIVDNRLRIIAGPTESSSTITFEAGGTDTTFSTLGFSPGATREGLLSGDVSSVAWPYAAGGQLRATIGEVGPFTLTLGVMADSAVFRGELEAAIKGADASPEFSHARVVIHNEGGEERVVVLSGTPGTSVAFSQEPGDLTVGELMLDNITATTVTALVSDDLAPVPEIPAGSAMNLTIGAEGPHQITTTATVNTLAAIASELQGIIRTAHTSAAFSGARVAAYDDGGENRIVVICGVAVDVIVFTAGPDDITTVSELRLDSENAEANVQSYVLGDSEASGPFPDPLPAIEDTAQGERRVGEDGDPPNSLSLIGDLDLKTGIYALEDVDLFNILCIPRTAIISDDDDDALDERDAFAVITAAINYCEKRRAFFIMDTPTEIDDVQEVKEWIEANATLRNKNAALYFPRIQIPDPLNEFRPRSVGASGTIAGLFARTDSARGVWKAPAGTEASLRNVRRLEYSLTDAQNGTLNPLAINCLRNLAVYGNVCWGARTLDGSDQQASEWKYVPVRRLALYLEESLYRGTKWVVFEPNDEPLWSQIRLNIGAFMHNLFRQGAFQGSTPRDAYLVKCDKETTTQNDINLGIVNILVGFAPLKPAEFVIIKIQQLAGQVEA